MSTLKCKMCGGTLGYKEGITVVECEYCGSLNTLPNIGEEKRLQLFDRANRLRSNCDFDRAFGVYEAIVAEYPEEAEAYWGLVLCKYGIDYVDDPGTGRKVPTCHRSSFDSVFDDSNFDMVMECCDTSSRDVYRSEAKQIEEIRKGIVEISSSEEPYDVFICYKETDEKGDRTIDSLIAQDIYDALMDKQYRVFFARISLEDKLGQEYEPYIFAALNSANIMLVVGTNYANYNAVWVKNEWSRFLKLMETNKNKYLIPCFRDIDAYDMPKEFNKLQSQDMSKVGAIQDLVRGIEKIIGKKEGNQLPVIQPDYCSTNNVNTSALLKRGKMALEDGDWDKANEFFEQVLNIDAECAEAYLGLAMAEFGVDPDHFEQVVVNESIDTNKNFNKAKKFAGGSLKEQIEGWNAAKKNKNDELKKKKNEEKQRIVELKRQIDDLESNEDVYSIEQLSELSVMEDELKNIKYIIEQKLSVYNNAKTEYDSDEQEVKDKKKDIESIIDQKELEKNRLSSTILQKNDCLRNLGIFKKKEKERIALEIESLENEKDNIEEVISDFNNEISDMETYIMNRKQNVEAEYRTYIESVSDYEGMQEKIQKYKNSIIVSKRAPLFKELFELSAGRGDVVQFGKWNNGAKRIEWIVLKREDNKLLLLSKNAIDCKVFNDVEWNVNDTNRVNIWGDCSLRKWLNGDFYAQAFDDYERMIIQNTTIDNCDWGETSDYVFLLSIEEAESLLNDANRKCSPTKYAIEKEVVWDEKGTCWWWLRSPENDLGSAACVIDDGSILSFLVCYDDDYYGLGVRPALWINFES